MARISSSSGDFATGAADIGGSVSALLGASGARAAAGSYGEAADIATENAALTKEATAIKLMQTEREIYKTLGAEKADTAGAGFASSGTALDLMRDSASQGALTKGALSINGAIQENAYLEQANQFRSMQKAAGTSSFGQEIGGLLQLGAGAMNIYGGASTLFTEGSAGSAGAALGGSAGAGDLIEGAAVLA